MMLQSNISFVSWLSSIPLCVYICFPGGTSDKASACQCKRLKRHGFNPWVGKIPRGRKWQPTLILSPGKFHGWRRLVGCSPWGHEGSDMTERLYFHFSLSCIGEGHGNLLQCSCLENPRDRGAWWAAVYGVAQSRTQLKRLSSSSLRNTHRSRTLQAKRL